MRSLRTALGGVVVLLALLLMPSRAETGSCPPGFSQKGNKCVRYSCPAGFNMEGGRCVRYSCRPGCTYIGGGKCRCYRR